MDPITHTFTGAALAAAGLRRATPLATAALILGANAPDVDVLSIFAGGYEELAFRRGWTHGVLALALWPFVLTALLLAWDAAVRRRRSPDALRARTGPLLLLCALAVATHPALDWLNNYGLRWLMPFDGRWFYGDALFIVDPWIWLSLGGVLFLMHSRARLSLARWTVFWTLASAVVLLSGAAAPVLARVLWIAGVAALFTLRAFGLAAPRREAGLERAARAALACMTLYIGAIIAAHSVARGEALRALTSAGLDNVEQLMLAPVAANPFAGDVVAATPDAYYTGRWSWFGRPRLLLAAAPIPRLPHDAVYEAAAGTAEARDFLTWSRFPYVETTENAAGEHVVRFLDARYRGTEVLRGPSVRLDRDLRPILRAVFPASSP